MMADDIIIPVQATMRRQPDGSYKMVEPEYIIASAATVARYLMDALHVPAGGGE